LSGVAQADPTPILRALQAHDWTSADILAVQEADPVGVKLVQFQGLLAPGQATAKEIADFLTANPGWPQQAALRRRLADALAADADDADARAICEATKPTADTALLRCADAEQAAGRIAQAQVYARQAWVSGVTETAAEASFLAIWGGAIGPDEQWRRFDTLAWANEAAADRQLARLDADHQALGAARLALRREDPRALESLAAVPAALRGDPILLLEQARFLRSQNDTAGALALWRSAAAAAESAAPAGRRAAFYSERDRLARLLLPEGDAAGAWFLADDALVGSDQAPDALFLAGWIALQRLHDPVRAAAKFRALSALSPAVITQGRAWYWLGRAAADSNEASGDLARAAAYPTTFYGQQAIARLNGAVAPRIVALRDPEFFPAQSAAFEKAELVRAGKMLAGWGDPGQARDFLVRQAQSAPDAANLVLTAREGGTLGLPDVAVLTARLAGRQGLVLPRVGWPVPYRPGGGADAPLVLGVMRQESSFDSAIVSAAGAVGLMQLMPETARQVGGGAAALTDPSANMQLGTVYLQGLLSRFGATVPYAVAAYNAGPRHVHDWIGMNGDAAASGRNDDMLDWIEQIPFAETRNYVQRVLENRAVYAAELAP
jgi:soluble lytic murein transglycosylase